MSNMATSFSAYIAENLKTPFEWGKHDCVLFASNWVKIATGKNPLKGLPKWKTERSALRAIKSVGGLEKALDDRFNRINPNLAKDGDVALYNGAVCLFSGPYIVGPSATGLNFFNRMEAKCAWSIS